MGGECESEGRRGFFFSFRDSKKKGRGIFAKRRVGSFSGIKDELATAVCPCFSKNLIKRFRISELDSFELLFEGLINDLSYDFEVKASRS